jgi:hypothetical protein
VPEPAPVEPAAPPAPATVALTVTSTPKGATVLLGSEVLGTTPFNGTMPRGEDAAELTVKLAGYKEKSIKVTPMRDIVFDIELAKKKAAGGGSKPAGDGSKDRSVNPFDY